MSDRFYFQNPSSGYPMILDLSPATGHPMVRCDEEDARGNTPTMRDLEDSREMTDDVRDHKDLYDAARYLKREYHAADILD